MTYDFLIVGGGIGGAVFANLLGRQGKRTILLERESASAPPTRPQVLWPATVRTLRSLLPRSAHESLSRPIQGIVAVHRGATVLDLRRDLGQEAGIEPMSTDPSRTRELLLRQSAVEVRRGVEVRGLLKDRDR